MSVMDTLVSAPHPTAALHRKAVPQDVVDDIVEGRPPVLRGANRQAVRLVVVNKPEAVAKVQPLVKWAAYLPPEQGTPKADELPTPVCGRGAGHFHLRRPCHRYRHRPCQHDPCRMGQRRGQLHHLGAINKPALTELRGIEEPQKLAFMVAFGYPATRLTLCR